MLLKQLHKQKKKISILQGNEDTVMFYSVYLNVPWIAVLSCVEFNLRGDIFLFNPPQKKTKQPKLPKISTIQAEKVEEVGSREQLCLQEYSKTL